MKAEYRLRLSENSVLKMFEPKREDVTGAASRVPWRAASRVPITEYYPGDKIRNNVIGGAYNTYGESFIQDFSGKT